MKGNGVYGNARFLKCEIAGAVALCALQDLRVNLFRYSGFPQISVEETEKGFDVVISVSGAKAVSSNFTLSKAEAFKAVTSFKSKSEEYDPAIFDRVQNALSRVVG